MSLKIDLAQCFDRLFPLSFVTFLLCAFYHFKQNFTRFNREGLLKYLLPTGRGGGVIREKEDHDHGL